MTQVDGDTFVGAIAEALEPRMRLTGQMDVLEKFKVGPLTEVMYRSKLYPHLYTVAP